MPVITEESVEVAVITPNDTPCGPARGLRFSDTGGLTQFGAFVEILPPGSRSSLCHWHLREDEMVYMLEGEVTLWEGGVSRVLKPGEAACFPAGVAAGHFLKNDGSADARYMVIGTRSGGDVITYPDHDRVYAWDAATGEERHTRIDGSIPEIGSAYRLPGA